MSIKSVLEDFLTNYNKDRDIVTWSFKLPPECNLISQAHSAILAEFEKIIDEELERISDGTWIDTGIRTEKLKAEIKAKLREDNNGNKM